MGVLTKISNLYKNITGKKYSIAEVQNREIVTNKIMELIDKCYYDEKTNTLVMNLPTNLVVSTQGSQLFIVQNGFKVDIAEKIHLNPVLSPQSKLNINRLNSKFNDIIDTFEEAITHQIER